MGTRTMVFSALAIGLLAYAVPAAAEPQGLVPPTDASNASANAGGLEEIIVTARKRPESILKTPVQEAAISAAELERFQAVDLKSVVGEVPSLVLGSTIGTTGNQITLRGVGTSTLNPGIDQSVSLNLDGLQLSQGLAYYAGTFDAAQLEVLKGPQALFYGKSSPGGVISIHSNDPTDTFEVIARAAYETEAEQERGEFIISGPVTDSLKLRLATMFSSEDGFFNNTGLGDPTLGGANPNYLHVPDTNQYIIRGTAIWQPTAAFDVKVKGNFTDTRISGTSGELQLSSCPGGVQDRLGSLYPNYLPFPVASPQFLTTDCTADRNMAFDAGSPAAYPYLPNYAQPYMEIKQSFGTLQAHYQIESGLDLTSVTGYYNMNEDDVGNDSGNGLAAPILSAYEDFHNRDVTEELRLASSFDSAVNFTVGAFVQNATQVNSNIAYVNNILGALPPFSFVPAGPNDALIHGIEKVDIYSQSVFGELLWKILPQVEFSGGVRWTHEKRELSEIDFLLGPGYIPTLVPGIASDRLDPEGSITYTPTDDLTYYVTYKQASKSGSFDIAQPSPMQNASFGDESVKGQEAGIKGRLFDRSFTFNIDAYHYRYSNLQVGEAILTSAGVVSKTFNAASSDIYGIDLGGTYRVPFVDGLRLRASANWNHARFVSFPGAPCWGGQTIAEGCNQNFVPGLPGGAFAPPTGAYTAQNLSGRPLLRAPDASVNFGFDYATPVFDQWTFSIASSTFYSSSYYTDLAFRSDMIQGSYFKTNLSLTLTTPKHDWEFAFIGNDLNDAITTGNCVNAPFANGLFFGGWKGTTTSGPLGQDQLECNFDPGRELWFRVTYRFSK